MKKNIANNKTVKKTEWITSTKCRVTYDDLSSEEMNRQTFEQIIRELIMDKQELNDIEKEIEEEDRKNKEADNELLKHIFNDYPEKAEAIKQWIAEDGEGFFGDYKVVESPLGNYEAFDEFDEFKDALKGHWVVQTHCSLTDTYWGTLTVQLSDCKYLQATFSQ